MTEIVVLVVFFTALAIGALLAELFGRLPTAKELADQDQALWSRYKRTL
jgi:hypothetical protein